MLHPRGVLIESMGSLENFRLTVFRKVAEHLSFRKAAEDLYLTQPAVSLQIKALEEEMNVVLLDRSGSQVKLTRAGEMLLKYAVKSNALLDEARQRIATFSGSQGGALSLGASTTIAQYVLPSLLSRFCALHPRVQPTLVSGNTEQIVSAVVAEKVVLGFIEGPAHSREILSLPFLEDEMLLIVPAAHEWAERAEVAPADLRTARLLLRERGSGSRKIIELALEKQGIRRGALHVVMELDSSEAIKSAVEAGLGVGFISRWALTKDARVGPALRIVGVKGLRFKRQFQMISPKGPGLEGLAGEFRNFVLTATKAAQGMKKTPTLGHAKPRS